MRRAAHQPAKHLCAGLAGLPPRLRGVALRDDERPRLQTDIGDKNFLMLRNLAC